MLKLANICFKSYGSYWLESYGEDIFCSGQINDIVVLKKGVVFVVVLEYYVSNLM